MALQTQSRSFSFRIIPSRIRRQNIRLEGQTEENFCLELNNGCICCTVRADMAKAVSQMLELHRSGKKLDGIIIETTGMANPAPVVQTFFADKALSNGVFLDGVITVVDAKHISTHLKKDGGEAVTQLAYADRVILNKIDLVSKDELKSLNEMIFKVNSTASIFETVRAQVDIKYLLDIRAFEVERILKTVDPQFLESASEFHGHSHDHDCSDEECSHPHHHHHECDESCDHASTKHDESHASEKHSHHHHEKKEDKHDHHRTYFFSSNSHARVISITYVTLENRPRRAFSRNRETFSSSSS